jgi:hypothetical protein
MPITLYFLIRGLLGYSIEEVPGAYYCAANGGAGSINSSAYASSDGKIVSPSAFVDFRRAYLPEDLDSIDPTKDAHIHLGDIHNYARRNSNCVHHGSSRRNHCPAGVIEAHRSRRNICSAGVTGAHRRPARDERALPAFWGSRSEQELGE